jgi:hypothetical protein
MNIPSTSAVPQPQKQKRGCFFYGCLTTIIAVLLVLVVMYVVATRSLKKFGTSAPVTLGAQETSLAEYHTTKSRLIEFFQKAQRGEDVEPLRLSGRDLSALLQHDLQFKNRTAAVSIDNNQANIRGSVPLEALGYQGMFLSGSAKLSVGMENGAPSVRVADVSLGDQALPPALLQELKSRNLLDGLKNDDQLSRALVAIGSMQIEGDAVVITPAKK